MKNIIVGGGGLALEVAGWLRNVDVVYAPVIREYEGFKHAKCVNLDGLKQIMSKEKCNIYFCTGKPHIKKRMHREIKSLEGIMPDYPAINGCIDKAVCTIGEGVMMMPNSYISVWVELAKFVLINYGATVGHNAKIGSYSTVSPNATIGGYCELGESVFVGAGANLKEEISIGSNSIIGMGAVVLTDVPDNSVVVGNPAKIYSQEEWDDVKSSKKGN